MGKTRLSDLALLGGPPAFDHPLHVGTPNLGNRDQFLARVDDILDRRRLSNQGPYLRQFEQRVADLAGVPHCIATCNGTAALQIAARALGLAGEVIVPSFTFIATPHALDWQGLRPVFCDIDPATGNLDPNQVERLLTPATTGILGVHVWGRPCAHDALAEIAGKYGLRLFYDASHAFGCTYHGRPIGSLGDAEVFSFHATKFVQSCEGGAIVTADDALAARLRQMVHFGFDTVGRVASPGINGKMHEISAAMGLTSLDQMDSFVAANYRNFWLYRRALARVPGLEILAFDETERNNFQYVILAVDPERTGLARDELWQLLAAENVLAKRYFHPPCHRLEPYRSRLTPELPATDWLSDRVLSLPTGMAIGPTEIAAICQILECASAHGTDVARAAEQRRLSRSA